MIAELVTGSLVVVSLTTLAIFAITATRRAGAAETQAARLDEQLKTANANTATQSARADFQEKRADALDVAIARAAATAVGPVAGSFARLLEEVAEFRASHSGGAGANELRDGGSAGGAGAAGATGTVDSDLLKPGE